MSTWNPKANDIFLHALELGSAAERGEYLDAVCAGDESLRADVESLLAAGDKAGHFLEAPAIPSKLAATIERPVIERLVLCQSSIDEYRRVGQAAHRPRGPTSAQWWARARKLACPTLRIRPVQPLRIHRLMTDRALGSLIGHYKLLEQIGEGGFGIVFMAEQQEPVRRKVALKVLKPGMDTRQVVARFEAERQALALMDHPNIAHVFDGGTTAAGRPYFVMDLVKGIPITEYCDQNHSSPRERLELFLQVCEGVQHAHQKGIIHRDVKPSNVLISRYDGTPVVKVIDFGIAKALGQQLTEKTLFTNFAQLIGTPLYMSPEQAGMSDLDVDTRSDIYSLGVLLYELLTGTTPFDAQRFKDAGFDEMRRIIREEEPPKPSTRVSTVGKAATTASANRRSDPKQLSRLFRGELDWIVMKALEKDRDRRYETANGLAMDVKRYLRDEPVLACPPSPWYRFRKFARRRKAGLAMVACVLMALSGVAGSVGWAVRDKSARDEANELDRMAREKALDLAVERSLEETGPLVEDSKWPEALAILDRAEQLLAAAGRTERPARMMELRSDLRIARRLEGIYRGEMFDTKPQALSPSSDATGYQTSAGEAVYDEAFFWGRRQDVDFAKAFLDLGIDVESLSPAEAAEKIRRQTIRAALIRALDGWAAFRKRSQGALLWRGEAKMDWKKLIEIARHADADDVRNRCRDALLQEDRQALEKLAAAVPIRNTSPESLYLLGQALKEVGALDLAMTFLKRAHREYPGELWLNDALADFSWSAFQPPRWDDALRYSTAVLALRPDFSPIHLRLADALKAKGADDEALLEYSKAIELEPKSAIVLIIRGNCYRSLGRYQEAIADYSKAIELEPNDAWPWDARGWTYRESRQYEKALADLNRALQMQPENADIRNRRDFTCWEMWESDQNVVAANVHVRRSEWNDAVRALSSITRWQPLTEHAFEYASLLLIVGDNKTYDEFFRKMIDETGSKIEPDEAYIFARTCGVDRRKAADSAKLIEWANRAMAVSRPAWVVHASGLGFYRAGQFDRALECLNEARVTPWGNSNDLCWFGLALTHQQLGHGAEARQCLGKAVEWMERVGSAGSGQPVDIPPQDWLEAHLLLREAEEVFIAACSTRIGESPNDAQAWSERGDTYLCLREYNEALADYSKAIELAPDDYAAWAGCGRIYLDLGQWDKAVEALGKAVDKQPNGWEQWHLRGLALARLGLWPEAAADLAQAYKFGEPIDHWHFFFHALLRAYVADDSGYLDACQRMIARFADSRDAEDWNFLTCTLSISAQSSASSRAIEFGERAVADGKWAWRLGYLGLAYCRAGDFARAATAFEESLALDANWNLPWIHAALALAQHRLGRREQALAALVKARDARGKQIEEQIAGQLGSWPRPWFDALYADLLYKEAYEQLHGSPPPLDRRLLVLRGRALEGIGRADEARAAFAAAFALAPDDLLLRVQALPDISRQDAYAQGLSQLLVFLNDHPGQPPGARLALASRFLRWGVRQFKADDPNRANDAWAQSVALAPELGPFVKVDDANTTMASCQKLADESLTDERFRLQLGHSLWEFADQRSNAGQPEEAEQALRSALVVFEPLAADFPEVSFYRMEQGFSHWKLGWLMLGQNRLPQAEESFHNAVVIYQRLADQVPRDFYYRLRLGQSHQELAGALARQGKQEEAVAEWDRAEVECTKAIELKADDSESWRSRAFTYFHRRQWDAAVGDFSNAIELAPNVHTAWWHRGHAHLNLARWDKAAADFAAVVEKWPNGGEGWYLRGVALANLDQPDRALDDLRQSIAKGFRNVALMKADSRLDRLRARDDFRKLVLEFEAKEAERIIAECSRALDQTHDDATRAVLYRRRGLAHAQLKNHAETLADWQHAVDAAPESAECCNRLAWLLTTCPDSKLHDPPRAVALAVRAVEIAPQQGMFWNTLGAAQYRAGEWQAAIDALNNSMELRKGGDAFDWFFLAMAHWRQGDKEQARKWYEKAVEWMEKKQPNDEELSRFHEEAGELGMNPSGPRTKP